MTISKSTIAFLFLAGLLLRSLTLGGAPLQPRSVAKGVFSGVTEANQEVIRDSAAWEQWWSRHRVNAKGAEKIPVIDFTKEMAITATMGRQRSGGYSIEVVGVETTGTRLQITVKRTSPPPGAMVMQALTAPFHVVAVPQSDLKPEFVEVKPAEKK